MKKKINIWVFVWIIIFTLYFFMAARPISQETVLIPRWLNSTESENLILLDNNSVNKDNFLIPFDLENRFGYISNNGNFFVNKIKEKNISLSEDRWAEYEAEPDKIIVYGNDGDVLAVIDNPGAYPFFLDGRIFLINSEQNAVSEIDSLGFILWNHEFASVITCVDAASGLFLCGSIDGTIYVLDKNGNQIFSFKPGGSRISVITGCAISGDGRKIAVISGVDRQRFLFIESDRYGSNYKVVYHEYLEEGFRRPVHVEFIENDQWVIFERKEGLGFYKTGSGKTEIVKLEGKITALDNCGGDGQVFAIISLDDDLKKLIEIKLPDRIILNAPFKSDGTFLSRKGSRLIIGGGQKLIAFDIDKN